MMIQRLGAGLALMLLAVGTAAGQVNRRDDDYRGRPDARYRYDGEREHREIVRTRTYRLTQQVRLLDRRDRVGDREADRLLSRLDRISDFVRRDRNFTHDEFRRRMDDLDDIQRALYRLTDRRVADRRHTYGRDCDLCHGVCRHRD
jgi:hypothetical protein